MNAYYNEIEPYAAAWLRNLIAAGHIAPGEVDERSIVDVRADDLRGFTQCHFFAGIGGWSLALRLAGWPDDRPVWTGSCPCQPFSAAGKGGGTADERHLWPEFFRLISERHPPVVFGEQVASPAGLGWLDLVSSDLEGAGYAVGAADLCAASSGAPHIRQRLWWVADSDSGRCWPDGQPHRLGEVQDRPPVERLPFEERSSCGRLADADGRHAGAEGLQRGGQHRQQPQDGGAVLVADSPRDGRGEERPHAGGLAAGDRAQGLAAGLGASGRDLGMGHPSQPGLPARERGAVVGAGRWEEGRAVEQPGRPSGGLADAAGRQFPQSLGRAQGRNGPGSDGADDPGSAGRPGQDHGGWGAADWLRCRDGKWRPVEPGTFPLAHGLPGRVGRLRAYGNAIVPAVAAEFIRAYGDTMRAAE